MSVHGLLNLLNELRKSDKMRGLQNCRAFFCSFRNKFNKYNNTGAGISDFIYHMTPNKMTLKSCFGMKSLRICHYYKNKVVMDVIT